MPQKSRPYCHEQRNQWRLRAGGVEKWLPRAEYPHDDEAKAWGALREMMMGVARSAPEAKPAENPPGCPLKELSSPKSHKT
jgi:hypothetical protein